MVAGALFFAMQSCEYTEVRRTRRTRKIRIRCIEFRKGKARLRNDSPFLHLGNMVSISFFLQKSDKKGEVVTMHGMSDTQLNPVIHWILTVRRYSPSTAQT